MSVAGEGSRGSLLQVAGRVVGARGLGALYQGFRCSFLSGGGRKRRQEHPTHDVLSGCAAGVARPTPLSPAGPPPRRASIVNDMLGNAVGFSLYELGCKAYQDAHGGPPPTGARGLIGAMAAAGTMSLTLPLEVVRRRLMVQGTLGRPVLYRSTLHAFGTVRAAARPWRVGFNRRLCPWLGHQAVPADRPNSHAPAAPTPLSHLTQILRQEGLRGFYGAAPMLFVKVAPGVGASYACFDLISRRLAAHCEAAAAQPSMQGQQGDGAAPAEELPLHEQRTACVGVACLKNTPE